MIQDEAANGSMEDLDIQHQVIETLDEVLESIVIRPLQLSREPVEDMSYQLKLSTPKRLTRRETGTLEVQLAKIEETLEKDEDM